MRGNYNRPGAAKPLAAPGLFQWVWENPASVCAGRIGETKRGGRMLPSTSGVQQPALQGRQNLIDVGQFPKGIDLHPFDDALPIDEDVDAAGEAVVLHKHAVVL